MSIQSEINRIKNNVAATYSAMEEQGATMPTQQNSANMAATARTIPTGSGGGTTVQADWSVNDSSNARYVKNRTHWKEVFDGPEGEIIPETSVAFTSNIKTITGAMSDAIHAGGLYIVTWNGTEYQCVGKSGSDGNYIGNGSFMNAGSITFEDTGEPFCVLLFGGTYYQLWKGSTTAETVTVKVVGKKETVWHKLDSRFLNEALQFGAGMAEILPETTVEIDPDMGEGYLTNKIGLVVGDTYAVKWNGAEYNCIAQDAAVPIDEDGNTLSIGVCVGDFGLMLGGESTGEPFLIIAANAIGEQEFGVPTPILALDGSTSVTLSIAGEVITKLDSKYLNEALQFGETTIYGDTLTWDGKTDGLVSVVIDEGAGFCKVSDSVITKENCANGFSLTFFGETIPLDGETAQSFFFDDGFMFTEYIAVVPFNNYFFEDMGLTFPEAGVYFVYADGACTSELVIPGFTAFAKTEVTKINKKFLPEMLIKMTVNFTQNENGDWVSDKTYAEVEEAIANGYTVDSVAYDGMLYRYMPLVVRGTIGVFFCSALVLDGVVTHTTVTLNENGVTYATVIK